MEPRIPKLQGGPAAAQRPYIPRRALMYVPANDERKLAKIPTLKADCVCLDIEDGVALDSKPQARRNIRKILDNRLPIDFGRSERSVRVNAVQSGGNLCHADLEEVFGGDLDLESGLPSAIHLPKVDDPEILEEFAYAFNSSFMSQSSSSPESRKMNRQMNRPIGLIIFIESARALVQLKEICLAAVKLKSRSCLVPEALVFGSDDYVADIGATRTADASELIYARQKVVTVAKAFGLQAIDLVHIDFRDAEGLEALAQEGMRMGFTGKQVIHPGQVDVVQRAFRPSDDKIRWAQDLIREFREHEASTGAGAFSFRGSMIDAPLVKQAQNIVDLANKLQP